MLDSSNKSIAGDTSPPTIGSVLVGYMAIGIKHPLVKDDQSESKRTVYEWIYETTN